MRVNVNNNNVNNNDNYNNNDNNFNNDNKKKSNNYIYHVGSFYPKFKSSQKNQNNGCSDSINNLNNYSDRLYFNIFHYYCFGKCFRKKKNIELYNLGLSVYKKRMDIINVFTLLLFTEKNCLQAEENYY